LAIVWRDRRGDHSMIAMRHSHDGVLSGVRSTGVRLLFLQLFGIVYLGFGTLFCERGPSGRGLPDHPRLMPTDFTTLPHFSVSSAMSLPKSTGEPGRAVAPSSASRVFILGSARPALTSLLSVSMISAGVPLGAPKPAIPLAS